MYGIDGKARLSTVNYVILDRTRKNAGGFQYVTDDMWPVKKMPMCFLCSEIYLLD